VTERLEVVTIRRPDDWHTHLRDGQVLRSVLPYTARVFGRAIVMPNLAPPITTPELADAYRERIHAALPAGSRFEPLLTCYLTDDSQPDEVALAGTVPALSLRPSFTRPIPPRILT
jgi:dihydroorotase